MTAREDLNSNRFAGRRNPQCALPIRWRVRSGVLRDHEMNADGAWRMFNDRPEVTREVVQDERSNFIEIEHEPYMTFLPLYGTRKPLRQRARSAGGNHRPDELGLG